MLLPLPPTGLREHQDPRDDQPHKCRAPQGSYATRPPRPLAPPVPTNGNKRCPEASLTLLRSLSMSNINTRQPVRSLLTDKPQHVPSARWRYRGPPASWVPIHRSEPMRLTYMNGKWQLSSQVQAWPGQGSYRTCCAVRVAPLPTAVLGFSSGIPKGVLRLRGEHHRAPCPKMWLSTP